MTISVEEALTIVVANAGRQPIVAVDLADALGRTLAEPAFSDLDSPPFDKALMDGYAVRDADLATGRAELEVVGELLAGMTTDRPTPAGGAYRIMTGAPLPPGADAVVMVERSRVVGDGRVKLDDPGFHPGQNVMKRGAELRWGARALDVGQTLGPAELGVLATIGHARPKVYARPTIALLTTGDEIVAPDQKPGPGQIRNSNGTTLRALATRAGAEVVDLGVANDDRGVLAEKTSRGLASDVLILSGGVSAGKRDLVPEVLTSLGVEKLFHQVEFKPGRPMWFGKRGETLVFGLPGNPVSVFACFELFVRTALAAREGIADPAPTRFPARLRGELNGPTKRWTLWPGRMTVSQEGFEVEPIAWMGSSDLRALVDADALLICPITSASTLAGAWVETLPLRSRFPRTS